MAARPLLAVDGDNLAHRAYHALPSSIKGGDGKPANMIVGFAKPMNGVPSEGSKRSIAWSRPMLAIWISSSSDSPGRNIRRAHATHNH